MLMKVFFDTNVYISDALVAGLARKIIEASIAARWRIFVSAYLLDETERVLVEKLGFGARFGKLLRQRIQRRSEQATVPASRHQVTEDPKDSPILQAALSAGVDYIVSDDRHLLKLNPYEGIRVLSMQEFATLLKDQGLLDASA